MSALPAEAEKQVTDWLGPGWLARPLAGDASVRAYYRVTSAAGETYILAWYPEEVRPQLRRFLSAYEAVAPHARLPEVMRHSDVAVLQRDVGDQTIYDILLADRDRGLRLYRAAIDLLVGFQKAPDLRLNPPFTAGFFLAELEMACEFYVGKLMQRDGRALSPMMEKVSLNIASHPYTLCHRDYHGQNIHTRDGALFLLDYQDLRSGPDTYDLASLLRDRGVARQIGDDAELELLDRYAVASHAEGDVRRRYFETLLQRSIKILGTFSKQPITRGRMHYLDFIPPTLESIRRCVDELPEFASLRDMFPFEFSIDAARDRALELNHAMS